MAARKKAKRTATARTPRAPKQDLNLGSLSGDLQAVRDQLAHFVQLAEDIAAIIPLLRQYLEQQLPQAESSDMDRTEDGEENAAA